MEVIKGYMYAWCNPKFIDIAYIKEHLNELDFDEIALDTTVIINERKYIFADAEYPIVLVNSNLLGKVLNISSEFYKEHKPEVDELIEFICRYKKTSTMKISESELLRKEVYEALQANQGIENVAFGNSGDIVYLSQEIYDVFKDGHVKDIRVYGIKEELRDNFDPIINYKKGKICTYTYEDLCNRTEFYIGKVLTDEELYYLKYMNKNAKVTLASHDFGNCFKIINNLKSVGFKGKIRLEILAKNDFNEYLFNHINELSDASDIEVYSLGFSNVDCDLLTYIKNEKRLIDMVLLVMNLSPFEKYLFAYRITKKFKEYKESEDKSSARDLYMILDNDYMVCVGYSVLLGDLLDKLGIENKEHSEVVDVGLDEIPDDASVLPDTYVSSIDGKEHEVLTKRGEHARREIHLVDPKYGIDGFFLADPTWDNVMDGDTYNYALMTHDEYVGIRRYNYFKKWGIDELFFVHSLEEFYLKINILMNKNKDSFKSEKDVIDYLIFRFKELDHDFYLQILSKFPNIKTNKFEYTKEIIQDIFLFIGEHIIEKTNNMVTGHKFKDAITVLYRDIDGLSGEELERKVNEVMEENKTRQAIKFPVRYMIDKDENKLVIMNGQNKFDLDNDPSMKF